MIATLHQRSQAASGVHFAVAAGSAYARLSIIDLPG